MDNLEVSESSQRVRAAKKTSDLVQAVYSHVQHHEEELEGLKDSEFYK